MRSWPTTGQGTYGSCSRCGAHGGNAVRGALRVADMPWALQSHLAANGLHRLMERRVLAGVPARAQLAGGSAARNEEAGDLESTRCDGAADDEGRADAGDQPDDVVSEDGRVRVVSASLLTMGIALDATYSLGEGLSGVGLYSREIQFGLAQAHPEVAFEWWYRWKAYRRSRAAALPPQVRRRLLAEPLWGPQGADLFHGLNQRLPQARMRRAIATFHDLFVMTGEYSTPEFRKRFTGQAKDAAARADAIIAVSDFTGRQVVELLGYPKDQVLVVHHGTRSLRFPDLPREKVVLSVGAIQKRKNTARLVEAFESLGGEWRLVLAGSFGYGAGEIGQRIEACRVRERISVLGYVTLEELAKWYARASIFAFPSLDEGFGMPVLEAMAAGVPVMTSNTSALPEVAGDAALLVDPRDAEEIAGALRRLAADETLRDELAEKGRIRARWFNWEKSVSETWKVYRRITA